MCAGLWHRQASVLPTHFIHPCWQPVYHSHSAVGPHLPNTSPKQRLLLETWYYNHCHTTPHQECTYTNMPLWFLISAPRSDLPFSGHCHQSVSGFIGVIIPIHGEILTAHQPANQCALTNGHSRPHSHLTALGVYCQSFLLFPICFCCKCLFYFFFLHARQILCNRIWPSPSQYNIIWCQHFLCVPLCSHYLPFIGCNSAAQHQINSQSMW